MGKRYKIPVVIMAVLLIAATAFAVNYQSNVFPPGMLQGMFYSTPLTVANGNSAPGQMDATARLLVSSESNKGTYRYSVQGITPVATPADVLMLQGSSTMTIRIKKIVVGGLATTAGDMPFQIIRRSTAGTKGSATLSAITAAQHDVNDAAPTATVSYVQTANYTTAGTSAGVIASNRVFLNVATAAETNVTEDFSRLEDKPLILRGTSDFIVVNFAGATVPSGGVLDFTVETEEDNS